MASSKEHTASRPISSSSLPVRQSASRSHSHSVSLGAMNPSHRISRRKSVTSNAAAAVAAAMGEDASSLPASSHRRSMGSKKGIESSSVSSPSAIGAYFAKHNQADRAIPSTEEEQEEEEEEAVVDGESSDKSSKQRNRRASEGAYLAKREGKRVSGELKCDTCGKGYKHSSCLTKHMWEHDPAWTVTSKFLISKHQQVQLLEAASVLVNMNQNLPGEEMFGMNESEGSSASPGFSGSSEFQDGPSSTETTPPPTGEGGYPVSDSKRFSNSSYSRSYHSVASGSFVGSVPSPGLAPYRSSVDHRPTTSGTDDGALAAAAADLGIYGTPRSRPAAASPDVPPVPPLPEQYQRLSGSNATPTMYNPLGMHPSAPTHQLSDERAIKSEYRSRHEHGQPDADMDDDDEGIFGQMEE